MRKMFSQIENINKEVEIIKNKPKVYSGIEKYNNWNENSSRKAQIWSVKFELTEEKESEMNLWTWR